MDTRIVQVFDSSINDWKFVKPIDVKKGDLFRMFEEDMTPVIDISTGKHEHVAIRDAFPYDGSVAVGYSDSE